MKSTTEAAFSAVRWNYFGLIARSGSNFFIGIVLARLLGPKPFGELAVANIVIGIANLIADAGFTSALIQAPTLTKLQIRHVFTVQFLIAIGMTLCCAGSAGFVASSFHDPAVRTVLLAISPVFILQAFGQTANALLRRDLAFRALQRAQITSYLVGYLLIGIPLARIGAGIWSLVTAQLVQVSFYAVLLYLQVRHALIPTLDRSGSMLLRFGAKVTVSNVVNYGISNADNFVVGHAFGSTSLGLYNRAFTLANAPADGIVNALQGVLFASCARANGHLASIRRAYLACLSSVAFIALPLFWAMAATAASVMIGLYGEKWRPAVSLFQPLVIALSIQVLMAMAGPILSSLDLVEREIQAQTFVFLLAAPLFWFASRHSLLALAWCVCGIYCFRFFMMTRAALSALGLHWRDVGRVLVGPAFVGVLTAGIVGRADALAGRLSMPAAVKAGFLVVTGAITVFVLVLLLGRYLFSSEVKGLVLKATTNTPRWLRSVLFGGTAANMQSSESEAALEAEQANHAKRALVVQERNADL